MPTVTIDIEIPQNVVNRVAERAAQMMRDRARAGIDAEGRPMKPYSTKPFARPLGGITQATRRRLGEKLKEFTTKQGKLWAVIVGGYAAYKKAAYPQESGGVNMTATGGMLRSLAVLEAKTDGTIRIGFRRQDEAEKAYYHTVAGAGKGKVIRDFIGLTEAEKQELAEIAASGLQIG